MNPVSDSTSQFLRLHGVSVPESAAPEEAPVISCFQALYPSPAALSEEGRAYLAALTDCLCAMDERLYHLYRPMADLLLRFAREAAPQADPGDPVWQDALARGARLGIVDPELLLNHPHLGFMPEGGALS